MKPGIIAIVASLAGLFVGFLIGGYVSAPSKEKDWDTVREYERFINDRKNYKLNEDTGFYHIDDVPDPVPSLCALHSRGEIEYIDLVFPKVPSNRASNKLWMTFCQARDGIIYATGNPSYTEFKTKGVHPLHLQIWFEERAKPDIKELIELLENSTREDANHRMQPTD